VPVFKVTKLYLDLADRHKDDIDFYLPAHMDKDDRKRDACIACIRICPIWSHLYNIQEWKKGGIKDTRFLYKKNEKRECRLVLPSMCNMNGKNYLEAGIKEAHDAAAHDGVEKTLK